MKSFYELLGLTSDASADEIKKAFRREIAKYHPDKVQHLGKEFQDIAAEKAAELTSAYKTLADPEQRADYDALLAEGGMASVAAPRPATAARHPDTSRPPTPPPPPPPAPSRQQFDTERRGVDELMQRAAVMRFQNAIKGEFGSYDHVAVPGFDVAVLPTPKFWSLRLPPGVLGKIVPLVNGQGVADAWAQASRMKKDVQRDLCVFLMGPALASATELALAIGEQRKRPMPAGGKLVVIPVNTRDWSAHVPTDAPEVCKSLLTRLKASG